MSQNEVIVKELNDLLTKNYDAEKGYQQAAEKTDDVSLKSFFERKAHQRNEFGHQIKDEIRALGGEPDKGSSTISYLHRAWMNVKATLSFDKYEAILEECERGEEASIKEYDEVLNKLTLPLSTRTLLTEQRNKVAEALQTVDTLEDVYDND